MVVFDSHPDPRSAARSGRPSDSRPEAELAPMAERVAGYLLAARTPRQQELGRRIYDQLKAGAEVDDIRGLVEELSRVSTEDLRHRRAVERQDGVVR